LICSLAAGLQAHGSARGEENSQKGDLQSVPTNFELLKMTIEEAIDEVCDRLSSLQPMALEVGSQSGAAGNWLVEQVLVENLLARDYRVIIPGSHDPDAGTLDAGMPDSLSAIMEETDADPGSLRYRIVTLDLDYPSSRRKHLFGPRLVERQVRLHLLFRLSRANGEVVWTEEARRIGGDWISANQLNLAEKEPLSIVSPRLRADAWGRFGEPVLLTAAVGGLIYLFYSTQ
jgi:hypothetical protein